MGSIIIPNLTCEMGHYKKIKPRKVVPDTTLPKRMVYNTREFAVDTIEANMDGFAECVSTTLKYLRLCLRTTYDDAVYLKARESFLNLRRCFEDHMSLRASRTCIACGAGVPNADLMYSNSTFLDSQHLFHCKVCTMRLYPLRGHSFEPLTRLEIIQTQLNACFDTLLEIGRQRAAEAVLED